jgi:hypothetical protein
MLTTIVNHHEQQRLINDLKEVDSTMKVVCSKKLCLVHQIPTTNPEKISQFFFSKGCNLAVFL